MTFGGRTTGYEVHIPSGGGGGGPPEPGTDKFAPRYLVGNVPNGDPAVSTPLPFRYIADPGDGTGIALAATEAIANPGDIWVRPGTYTWTGTDRISIPANRRLRGAGRGLTTIVNDNAAPDDNTMFELAAGAELAQMSIVKGATLGGKGSALVQISGVGALIDDVDLDLSVATAGGSLTAAILVSGVGSKHQSVLRKVTVTLPSGGGGSVSAWLAGIRGSSVNGTHICSLEDVWVSSGDAAVLTIGVEMLLDAVFSVGAKMTGFYASGARLSATARQCIVELTKGGALAGCQLIEATFAMHNARFSTTSPASIPAIYVSGGAGVAVADIADNEVGAGFSPAILIGDAAEVAQDCRVHGNRIALTQGSVPVAIGTGGDNTLVVLNVSRGSGAIGVSNAGTGTQQSNNVWGA